MLTLLLTVAKYKLKYEKPARIPLNTDEKQRSELIHNKSRVDLYGCCLSKCAPQK
jgi:hypothetical protein